MRPDRLRTRTHLDRPPLGTPQPGSRTADGSPRFLAKIGGEPATWTRTETGNVANIGGYRLDHNGTYGGWVIEQNVNESGGISHPFGYTRMTGGEIVNTMMFAMNAIDERDRNQKGEN
jgi:hypothetical protein